jgi:hypothetical protein
MKDLLKTLIYELLAPTPLPLLQRALELSLSAACFLSAYTFSRRSPKRCPAPITVKEGVPCGAVGKVGRTEAPL